MSDYPTLNTGFAKATRTILSGLAERECMEVHCAGWGGGHAESPGFAIPTYPLSGPGDLTGIAHIADVLRPSATVVMADHWHAAQIPRAHPEDDAAVVVYCPVDASPIGPRWSGGLARADALVSTSQFGADQLSHTVPGMTARAIRLGVSADVFHPLGNAGQLRRASCFGPDGAALADRFVVGCVARNQPRKGLTTLIEAFAGLARRHEDAFLYLHTAPMDVGWDIPELLQRWDVADRAALPSGVSAIEGCSDAELNRLYNLMDVFVLPTAGEGFGLPILEAMAAGVPVVATDCAAVPELVTGRGELIRTLGTHIPPGASADYAIPDPDHLEEILEALYHDADLRARHSAAGRQLAEELTWDACADQWADLLGEVTAPQRDPLVLRPTAAEEFTRVLHPSQPGRGGPSVALLTPSFYDPLLPVGNETSWMGGGERYLIDLADLLRDLGAGPVAFQPSVEPWRREYRGLPIYGLGVTGMSHDVFPGANVLFHDICDDYDAVIYLCFDMCYPHARPGSIAISHGIWWDYDQRGWWRTPEWRHRIYRCVEAPGTIVSVDTNTMNWVRAERPDLAYKLRHLPNSVDLSAFSPGAKARQDDITTVLFPRRLVPGRGYGLMVDLARELAAKRDDVRFEFVGRGDAEAETEMRALAARNDRIRWQWRDMTEMPDIYRGADITVIPTLFSEGTSLSCLEAMASGNAVLVTNVGGLSDLVIDGYNGLMVEPNPSAVREGLVRLLRDPELRAELADNALRTVRAFSRERWRQRWTRILAEVHPDLFADQATPKEV
ncbi:MAG: glycosyltransferase [Armatimonadia bacterium]|nr:glycosyltransferase [Armatimonadia bacterium]